MDDSELEFLPAVGAVVHFGGGSGRGLGLVEVLAIDPLLHWIGAWVFGFGFGFGLGGLGEIFVDPLLERIDGTECGAAEWWAAFG